MLARYTNWTTMRINENKISMVCIISVKVGTVCNWWEDVIVYTDFESLRYVQVVIRISRKTRRNS